MKPILNIYDFLPVLLLLTQTLIFLAGTIAVLRFLKIVQLPFAGMEYAKLVTASVILISMMMISFADVEGMMKTVNAFHNYGDGVYRNVFIKFSQFVLVIIVTQCFFGLLCFTALKIIPGFRQPPGESDNMPVAVLKAVVMVVLAVLLYACAKEIIETLTPKYISFT